MCVEEKSIAKLTFQRGDGFMSWIGFDLQTGFAPEAIKTPYERGICVKSLRRCHLLHGMPFPQPIHATEGRHTAFRRNTGAREHQNLCIFRSEERRVGKESRCQWARQHEREKVERMTSRTGP